MIVSIAAIILVMASFIFSQRGGNEDAKSPDGGSIFNAALVVAVVGGVLGAVAWLFKEIYKYTRLRSEMYILELLSDRRPRTFEEILDAVEESAKRKKKRRWYSRDAAIDGLAELVSKDEIYLEDGLYSVKYVKNK